MFAFTCGSIWRSNYAPKRNPREEDAKSMELSYMRNARASAKTEKVTSKHTQIRQQHTRHTPSALPLIASINRLYLIWPSRETVNCAKKCNCSNARTCRPSRSRSQTGLRLDRLLFLLLLLFLIIIVLSDQ